jgi:competence protein ComEC
LRIHFPTFLERQKSHLFLYVPICFGLGIAAYFSLRFEPSLSVGYSVFFGALIFFAVSYKFINNTIRLGQLAILLCISGFVWSGQHTAWHSTVMLTKAMGPKMVEGVVHSLSHVEGNLTVAVIEDVAIEGLKPYATPSKIKLRSYHVGDGIRLGDRVSVLTKLNPPSRPVIPGGFDFQRRSFFLGIGATGFTLGEVNVIKKREDHGGQTLWEQQKLFFEGLRFAINGRIEGIQSPEFAGLSKALITGDRSAIRDEDYDALKSAGLAHLLAISGLHIGLVSGFVFVTFRFFLCLFPVIALRYPIKKYAAALAIASALFYMLLAGATIPTQRAALTSSLIFLSVILDRKAISLRLVAFAALSVLLISPESLLSASFQHSFEAVLSLISFY